MPDPVDVTPGPHDITPDRIDVTPGPHDITPDHVDATGWRESGAVAGSSRAARRRRIALGSALVVGLAVAAGLGTAVWRIGTQKNTMLDTPPAVPGLARDDSQRARSAADYLRNGLAADIALDRSIAAVYNDPADAKRSVLLFGGTALLWQPERDLDRLFHLVSGDSAKPGELRKVAAGALGGVMKCGTTPTQDGDLAVCGWADHGSVVFAMFPGRGVEESAGLLRVIRGVVQTRT
jgi:hypothetical protein